MLLTSLKSNHKPKHPDGARGSRESEPVDQQIIPNFGPSPSARLCFLFHFCVRFWFGCCVWPGFLLGVVAVWLTDRHHRFPGASTCCICAWIFPHKATFPSSLDMSVVFTRSGWSCERLWFGFASRFTTGPPHGVDVEPNKCSPVSLCWCEFLRRFDMCKLFTAFQNCFCWHDLLRFSFDFHLYTPLSEFFLLSIF